MELWREEELLRLKEEALGRAREPVLFSYVCCVSFICDMTISYVT